MKSWKNLLVPAIVLVLLIVGLVVYNVVLKDKLNPTGETTSATSATDEYVVNYKTTDLSSIHVLKKDGTGFTVKTSAVGADGAAIWSFASDNEDVSAYKFSQKNLSSFVTVLASCEAVDNVTDSNDTLSLYGLDTPLYSITFKLSTGETHILRMGNESFDGKKIYCMLDNSGVVKTTYIIKATSCDVTMLNFLDLAITSAKSTDVSSVSFKRTEDNLDIVVSGQQVLSADGKSSEFGWVVTSPFTLKANETFGTLMDSLLALTVTSYVDLNPNNYAKYGLDKPAYTFDITMASGKKMQIILSKDMGGIYYGASTESPAVFTLGTSVLTGLQTPLLELVDAYLDYEFISNVKNIEAKFPDGSFTMDMAVAKNAKITDKDSVVKVNGINAKVVDNNKRSYFAVLYEGIACMNITGFDFDAKPVDTKDATIIITRNDSTQTTIDLAVKDENTYYAFIDGKYVGFLVSKDEVYKDNGSDLYDYGAWAAYKRLIEAINGDDGSGVYVISDS